MTCSDDFMILLVEDNEIDAKLALRAARQVAPVLDMEHVADGEVALERLRREERFDGAKPVDLVLLDLHLPRLSGHEVLEIAKGDPALRTVPIVILTSSTSEEDVRAAYEARAAAFLTKPVDYDALSGLMETMAKFWTRVQVVPAG